MRWVAAGFVFTAVSWAAVCRADDELDGDVVEQVKAATVYLRVESSGTVYHGTGFVVRTTGDTCYIGTNAHVVSDRSLIYDGSKGGRTLRPSKKVKVVFRSGRKEEWSASGEVTEFEVDHDLAIVKVEGVRRPPRPLVPETVFKFRETMPLYVFGFPRGDQLAVGESNPTVTIGRSSVSGLTHDRTGKLLVVRIDETLSAGNSGGPVVSTEGRVVGVATIPKRDAAGIGLCVPGAELKRLCPGRSSDYLVAEQEGAGGQMIATARIVDTMNIPSEKKIASVAMYYVRVANTIAKPAKEPLGDDPAATVVPLTVNDAVASAAFTVDLGGERSVAICAQFKTLTADGETIWSDLVRATSAKAAPPPALASAAPSKALPTPDAAKPSPLPKPATTPKTTALKPASPSKSTSGQKASKTMSEGEVNKALAELRVGDTFAKQAAAGRLARHTPTRARPEIARALEAVLASSNSFAQQDAARALAKWGDAKSVKPLLTALDSKNTFLRSEVLDALAEMGATEALPRMIEMLQDFFTRSEAESALKKFGSEAEEDVCDLLTHSESQVRRSSCNILREIGTAISLPRLEAAMQDKDRSVQSAAQSAHDSIKKREQEKSEAK